MKAGIRASHLRALVFIVAIAALPDAQAQFIVGYPDSVMAYDPREIALLPPYCKHTQDFRGRIVGGNNQAEIERWKSVLGPTYEHMHHYCWGLMKSNRATLLARTEQARLFYLADSVREFTYVIERSPDDFILLPEVLTKKGENMVRLGKGPLGMMDLRRAIEIKADYWPPYAAMSDYYKDAGDSRKAREVLEQGLSAMPEAAALKRRLAELDQRSERLPGATARSKPQK